MSSEVDQDQKIIIECKRKSVLLAKFIRDLFKTEKP